MIRSLEIKYMGNFRKSSSAMHICMQEASEPQETLTTWGTSVQYCERCSVHRGMFTGVEGHHQYFGGTYSVLWRDAIRTMEVIPKVLEVPLNSTEWCPSTVLMVSAHSAENPPCTDGIPHQYQQLKSTFSIIKV